MRSEYKDFQGFEKIVGIDEAGRGPIAGPVVVASVVLPQDCRIKELNDSKKLTAKKRNMLFDEITYHALHYEYVVIDHKIIDQINILQATFKGMNELLIPFRNQPYLILIDGPYLPHQEFDEKYKAMLKSIVKGDNIYHCIAAASIVAKVVRDRIMDAYHRDFKQYDFIHNKGYPTKKHKEAIAAHGISPIPVSYTHLRAHET